MTTTGTSTYTTRLLDADTWEDFAELVDANNGVWGGCWCMGFHPEGLAEDRDANRAAKLEHVRSGTVRQVLVYDGERCVGWCQYGSPAELPNIKNPKAYDKELSSLPDWRIGCVFTGKDQRRAGVARAAVSGALEAIAASGGGLVEAYPEQVEGRGPQRGAYFHTGPEDLFVELGFERDRQIAKALGDASPRPIVTAVHDRGRVDLEPYRGELVASCYRMLGSFHEAEDAVQETMLRAWKARDRYDPARASVRTWLHRIATNVCLTALEGRGRRPLPSGLGAPSADHAAPLVPAPDVPWLEPFPDARYDVEARADLRLAWVAATQTLPARQRAVLVLRDVLAFTAAEVAGQLETTVAAVNSMLQRARAAVSGLGDADSLAEPDDPRVRAVVSTYVRAFEAADVPALVRLLADDAVLEMPPVPLWYRGSTDYGRFMDRVFEMRGPGWRVRELTANGQPAFAAYAPDPEVGHRLHTVQVLSVVEGRVASNVVFADPSVLDAFGLPREIAGEGMRSRR